MGDSDRDNGRAGPGSQQHHKLEPHVMCIYDRPIQPPRVEGAGTYVSTRKLLHLFHSFVPTLVPLRRRRFRRLQRLKCGRESGCVPCSPRTRSRWESDMVRCQYDGRKTCLQVGKQWTVVFLGKSKQTRGCLRFCRTTVLEV